MSGKDVTLWLAEQASCLQKKQRAECTIKDAVIGGRPYQISEGFIRVIALRDELIDVICDPESTIQQIRERKLPADLFTFLQRPTETTSKFSYHMEWDNLAALQISTYDDWFKRQIHPNTRTNLRKAAKSGLVIKITEFGDELAAGLVTLFNETPIRQGKRYPYYGWDLEMVKRAWAARSGESLWVVAYYREQLVGFVKLILSDGIAKTSGTIAKEIHRDKAPMNALLAKCVELCASIGIRLLVYGRFVYGRKGEDSLTAFKRHNGFKKIELRRYHVPLSRRGKIGLRLGLHRRLNERIPGPALRVLLKLRSKWYEAGGWKSLLSPTELIDERNHKLKVHGSLML
jgi:hypothetical protein